MHGKSNTRRGTNRKHQMLRRPRDDGRGRAAMMEMMAVMVVVMGQPLHRFDCETLERASSFGSGWARL